MKQLKYLILYRNQFEPFDWNGTKTHHFDDILERLGIPWEEWHHIQEVVIAVEHFEITHRK